LPIQAALGSAKAAGVALFAGRRALAEVRVGGVAIGVEDGVLLNGRVDDVATAVLRHTETVGSTGEACLAGRLRRALEGLDRCGVEVGGPGTAGERRE